ncbi:MAG: hypothetical protein HKO57_01495, partial [Akkermansiaceae bacterium]|nr:hypothetical protein [Akkermansiaceae bacterium]
MSFLLTSIATALVALGAVRLAMRRDPGGASLLTHGSILLLLALPMLAALPKLLLVIPSLAPAGVPAPATLLSHLGWLWAAGCAVVALRFLADEIA